MNANHEADLLQDLPAITEAELAALHDRLAELPRRQREAVAYHYLAGLPYAEVAAVTGGSTDAARRAAADGHARLRKTYPGGPAAAPEHGETP